LTLEPGPQYPVVDPADANRVVCMDCERVFREGDFYMERLIGVAGDTPVVDVVCLNCGHNPQLTVEACE